MKQLNETFTDEEFEILKKRKGAMSWHDFLMQNTTNNNNNKGGAK